MYKRWSARKFALLLLFTIMQLAFFVVYWTTHGDDNSSEVSPSLRNTVAFIPSNANRTVYKKTYFTEKNTVVLTTKYVENDYEDFNSSLCYKHGTNVKVMKRSKYLNWKCECLSGWHGSDCGQPEVIWRALLALRKRPIIPTLRKTQRRLVYFLEANVLTKTFPEIVLHELSDIVDLFVMCDLSNTTTSIETDLKRGYLEEYSNKILYITGADRNVIWKKARSVVRNLRDDDIFFINNPYEVPNWRALRFLKLYDKWPEPLTFRLKWSVYGFFWRHPKKTVLSSGACTLKYLYEALGNDVHSLKTISDTVNRNVFIIGDLNHFGGWYCEFCNDPTSIIKSLQLNLINNSLIINNLSSKKINVAFLEDFIENGIYLNGKTSLERVHRSRENYYAPDIVSSHTWKYDWLLINLYAKIDY